MTNNRWDREDKDIAIVIGYPSRRPLSPTLEAGKHDTLLAGTALAVHGSRELPQELLKTPSDALLWKLRSGGIPILRTLVNSLASDKVTKVLGVVNGASQLHDDQMVRAGLMKILSRSATSYLLGINDVEESILYYKDGDLERLLGWYPIWPEVDFTRSNQYSSR